MKTIRAPGREITIGEAVRKLNPHLFSSLDAETKQILDVPVDAKRIRQRTKPLSNKLEAEFGAKLKEWHPACEILEQAITIRLANGVKYTPDWAVLNGVYTSCYEVKGKYAWDDAIVKLKVAASRFPGWRWNLAWKENGEWKVQLVI